MALIQEALVWDMLVFLPTHGKCEVRVNSLLMTGYKLATVSSCLHKDGFQPQRVVSVSNPSLLMSACSLLSPVGWSLGSLKHSTKDFESASLQIHFQNPEPVSGYGNGVQTHQSLSLWFRNILKGPRLWTSSCWKSFPDQSFVGCS